MPKWLLLLLVFAVALGGDLARAQSPQQPEATKGGTVSASAGHGGSSAIVEAKEPQPIGCSKTSTASVYCPSVAHTFLGRVARGHAPPHKGAADMTLLAQHVLLRV